MKLCLINVAVAIAIVARDKPSFADKPCCVMNGSSTIAPKTRRTDEFRPEKSFIVWILSRLDIKSDLLSSLLSNLLSNILSILGACDAATSGIVSVVVLRDDVGWESVADLQQLVVGVVSPRGSKAVGIGEGRLEVRTRQIRPRECAFILNGRAACSSS